GSLRRPGGNATGFTCVSADLVGKRFSLLRSMLPQMGRVAMLYNKRDNHELEFRDAEEASQSLNVALLRFPVASAAHFEPAFKVMKEEKCDALYIFASAFAQGPRGAAHSRGAGRRGDRVSNCVVGSGGSWLPCSTIAEHSVEGCDHFSHNGDDDDLGFFV